MEASFINIVMEFFNMSINDFENVPDKCKINICADDTIMWFTDEIVIEKLNQHFKMYIFKMNSSKIKCMSMTK